MTRTYIITGAASGIGAKTAELLREQGHTVVGVDLQGVEVSADLSTPDGRAEAARLALEATDGIVDAVIPSAGLAAPKAVTAAVNYFGMTEFLEALQPALARSEAPRVALVSSMSSLQPLDPALVEALMADDEPAALARAEELAADPATGNLIYASSKRAISRWVRRESTGPKWAGAGIPLNAVAPGIVRTPMTQDMLADPQYAAFMDMVVPMPLNGHQDAESVARLLIWLTSVENSHCCGQTFYADGGADAVLRGEDVWGWNDEAINAKFAAFGV